MADHAAQEAPMIRVTGLRKSFTTGWEETLAVNDVSFDVQRGQLITLLGPSGCGKTTTLRMLAGLERPTGGSITIDGQFVSSDQPRVYHPAHRRPIGMVFQSYAIWPHMTVAGNVAFPLRVERPRIARSDVRRRVKEALALVGLEGYGSRPATALSGGQQQRVALARALVREPKVLLLDEPLSNLDAELRDRMRDEIRELQQRLGITTVFVTHDQAEALAMSDRVIVMNEGRIVEAGPPQAIYNFPRHSFTAKFLGVSNSFPGKLVSRDGDIGTVTTACGSLTGRVPAETEIGTEVLVAMRPDSFTISETAPGGAAWQGRVLFGTYHGDAWVYHVEVAGYTIKTRMAREQIGLSYGDDVFLVPEPTAAVIIDDGVEPQDTSSAKEVCADGERLAAP